jgi:hypothetical protein
MNLIGNFKCKNYVKIAKSLEALDLPSSSGFKNIKKSRLRWHNTISYRLGKVCILTKMSVFFFLKHFYHCSSAGQKAAVSIVTCRNFYVVWPLWCFGGGLSEKVPGGVFPN